MWEIQVIEFLQVYGLYVTLVLAFIMALSVSAYWVAKPAEEKLSPLGVLFSAISLIGVAVMIINLKIGLAVAVTGYVFKSIFLVRRNYGVGSFVRPLLYFKRINSKTYQSEEDVLDLF